MKIKLDCEYQQTILDLVKLSKTLTYKSSLIGTVNEVF